MRRCVIDKCIREERGFDYMTNYCQRRNGKRPHGTHNRIDKTLYFAKVNNSKVCPAIFACKNGYSRYWYFADDQTAVFSLHTWLLYAKAHVPRIDGINDQNRKKDLFWECLHPCRVPCMIERGQSLWSSWGSGWVFWLVGLLCGSKFRDICARSDPGIDLIRYW